MRERDMVGFSIGRTFRTIITGVVASGLFTTNAFAAGLAPLNPPQKVKVAYVPIMKFATAYVAADRGLFKKYGLDVELEKVKSGTEASAFLTHGSADVGGIAMVPSLGTGLNPGPGLCVTARGGLEPMKESR